MPSKKFFALIGVLFAMASLTGAANNAAPVAKAGGPYSGTTGVAVTLDGSASTGKITGYCWNFGDGTAACSASIASHVYWQAGLYTVTLTVTDQKRRTSIATAVASITSPTVPDPVPPPPPAEICGDGIDNDGDGLIDEGCPTTPPPSGRTRLTLNDLQWQGMYRTPDGDGSAGTDAGTTSFTNAPIAIRYVNGERRLLMANFSNAKTTVTGRTWGDVVEYRLPSVPYMGSDPTQAPALQEVRRWAADWTLHDTTPSWQDPNSGDRLGSLYWDEAQGVLWYQIYGYYSGLNRPFLGATQLLDTPDPARGGTYVQTGAKYGPWWYRSSTPTDTPYWKAVYQWMLPVPASSQAALGGRTMLLGAAVGSIGGTGHLGPGLHAIGALPPLTDAANTVLSLGMRIADYTDDSPTSPHHAKRDTNYSFTSYPAHTSLDTGLYPGGYWQMSLDQVNGAAWVETATKEGVLLFGRAVHGRTAYGFNPLDLTPEWTVGDPSFADPSRSNPQNANGYLGEAWAGAVYVFDPDQIREVGQGLRSPYNDGMNPILLGDWHVQWPNIPIDQTRDGNATTSRVISSFIGGTAIWDPIAQQVIWCNPTSESSSNYRPTIHVFTIQ